MKMTSSTAQTAADPRRTLLLALTLLLCAGAAVFLYMGLRPSTLSDQDQISAILDDFQAGTATQDAGKIFSHLAPGFHIDPLNRQQARLELNQFFRQHSSTEVVFRGVQTAISGDTAAMQADVEVTGAPASGGNPVTLLKGHLQMNLVRIPTHRFWIFPDHAWAVSSALVPGAESLIGM
ncbi:MAG TPA: hypothetical protein VFJ58_24540 [Armatimonadota bacterium]|nr:hypothetical protein [Armatimonadota bacterium]